MLWPENLFLQGLELSKLDSRFFVNSPGKLQGFAVEDGVEGRGLALVTTC